MIKPWLYQHLSIYGITSILGLETIPGRPIRGWFLHLQVTESAKLLLDAGEDVPCELMAFVLKFQMLQVKASDQLRRAAEEVSQEPFEAGEN